MERPANSATRSTWNEYAESIGLDPESYNTKEELILAVSERETETSAAPGDTDTTVPEGAEELEGVPKPENLLPEVRPVPSESLQGDGYYATDPAPGGVVLAKGETMDDVRDDQGEPPPVLWVGSWVKLADTDNVIDQGGRVGDIAVVIDSPHIYVESSDFSPRRHVIQNPDLPVLVKTRDERSVTLSVDPAEDVEMVSGSGRAELLPIG
jgi:hypothetical protein